MYGAINGSYINFGGLNAAGGEALNSAFVEYTQENQTLSASASVPITADTSYTQTDQTLSASASVPITADTAYTQDDQAFTSFMSVLVSASLAYTQPGDTVSGDFKQTMIPHAPLGSSILEHTDGQSLTAHNYGSRIEEVH